MAGGRPGGSTRPAAGADGGTARPAGRGRRAGADASGAAVATSRPGREASGGVATGAPLVPPPAANRVQVADEPAPVVGRPEGGLGELLDDRDDAALAI